MSQPDPIPGERPVAPYARKRFRKLQKQRAAAGLVIYGRPLETYNGRDALQDAMEEAVDLWNYLCQMELERATEHARVELLQQENERLKSALQRAGKWRAEASRIRNEHAAGDTTHADQLRAAYEENAKLHRALNTRNEEQEAFWRIVEACMVYADKVSGDKDTALCLVVAPVTLPGEEGDRYTASVRMAGVSSPFGCASTPARAVIQVLGELTRQLEGVGT